MEEDGRGRERRGGERMGGEGRRGERRGRGGRRREVKERGREALFAYFWQMLVDVG